MCTNKKNVYIKKQNDYCILCFILKTKVLCDDKTKVRKFFNPEE